MRTPWTSIACFLVASFLGAAGQFLYKTGADGARGTLGSYVASPRILAGVACYVAVMVLFVSAFRLGGDLKILYPIYATTFIWAALIGWFAFGTPIRPVNVAGMVLILVGMALMGIV